MLLLSCKLQFFFIFVSTKTYLKKSIKYKELKPSVFYGALTLSEKGGRSNRPIFVFSYLFLKRIIPFPFWSIKGEAAKKINIHGCIGPKSYNYVGMFATTKREIDIFALYPIGGEIWFIIFGFAGYGN